MSTWWSSLMLVCCHPTIPKNCLIIPLSAALAWCTAAIAWSAQSTLPSGWPGTTKESPKTLSFGVRIASSPSTMTSRTSPLDPSRLFRMLTAMLSRFGIWLQGKISLLLPAYFLKYFGITVIFQKTYRLKSQLVKMEKFTPHPNMKIFLSFVICIVQLKRTCQLSTWNFVICIV